MSYITLYHIICQSPLILTQTEPNYYWLNKYSDVSKIKGEPFHCVLVTSLGKNLIKRCKPLYHIKAVTERSKSTVMKVYLEVRHSFWRSVLQNHSPQGVLQPPSPSLSNPPPPAILTFENNKLTVFKTIDLFLSSCTFPHSEFSLVKKGHRRALFPLHEFFRNSLSI